MNDTVISTQGLTKKFGDFTATDHITFDVAQGEVFGFLGANGAGKTTAIKMLCGLLTPTSGEATIAGFDIYEEAESIKKVIGYMSQRFSLYQDLTIRENVHFYGGIYGLSGADLKDKANALLARLGLKDEADKLVSGLPLGWKQKLAFSVSILHEPRIVFLDEPTSGVDPVARRQFWEMIYEAAERGITVFVTTHYMDEAEYCDRISIMVDGVMEACAAPSELVRQYYAKNVDDVFYQLARKGKRME